MNGKSILMANLKLLKDPHQPIELPQSGSLPREWHVFEPQTIAAVNAALAARRPLLVRGEPGVGKSQLARAAAQQLGRAFISFVIDSRTEARDLLYHFDAVQRLADAQIYGHTLKDVAEARRELDEAKYLRPGPFWWAYHWEHAEKRGAGISSCIRERPAGWTPAQGCTVLIDEIDKGESDVPNGLLEVLGSREFTPQGTTERIVIQGTAPLVIITTNAERILPDAFLRRCFVLSLDLPEDRAALVARFVERGTAHFAGVDETVILKAAEIVADARLSSRETPRVGQAEFLDLLRAASEIEQAAAKQIERLQEIAQFVLTKRGGSDAV